MRRVFSGESSSLCCPDAFQKPRQKLDDLGSAGVAGIKIFVFQMFGELFGCGPELWVVLDGFDPHLSDFGLAVPCGVGPLVVFQKIFDVLGASQAVDGFFRCDCGEACEVVAFNTFLPSLTDPFAVVEFPTARPELDVAGGDILPSGCFVMERPGDVHVERDAEAVYGSYHKAKVG